MSRTLYPGWDRAMEATYSGVQWLRASFSSRPSDVMWLMTVPATARAEAIEVTAAAIEQEELGIS